MRYLFILIALVIAVVSVLFTNRLAGRLAHEEQKKIEIWAEATRQFILADGNTDIDFVSSIIEGNTTIPVYIVDQDHNLVFSRNIVEPVGNKEAFYAEQIARLRARQEPIEVRIDTNFVQYIYYDDSLLLKQLYYFPYIQFGVIFIFIFVAFLAFASTQRAEQNQLWVGLSKETAHQLGTPISSLLAWSELLRTTYPDDTLLPEMSNDINRLRIVAERFSKIGSKPELNRENVVEVIQHYVAYMRNRTSAKVRFEVKAEVEVCITKLNLPLFEWVIENLCKNAIDAIEGSGAIVITIDTPPKHICIDITDTGKGIERSKLKKIFKPGFTTKTRGWGLGLSLTKRIVEEYHNGKIFVKASELGKGTTFRILLNYY